VRRVFETDRPGDQRITSHYVRFSLEVTSLRQTVELVRRLRRASAAGLRVRPARVSGGDSTSWTVLVTTPLSSSGTTAFEEEIRRIARLTPGVAFTGWLYLSGSVEAVPRGPRRGTMRSATRVLIIDGSYPFRRTARELLKRRGYRVVGEAGSAVAGFEAVERLRPDAVLLDVRLPDGSGLDLCEVLTGDEDAPAILLVSSDGRADAVLAHARGGCDLVPKADLAHIDLQAIWA
jgi:CheY-like chemotaxis protein